MGRIETVGMQPTVVRHNIDRRTGVASHENFWRVLFRSSSDVAVITTNYDILCERGLRIKPRLFRLKEIAGREQECLNNWFMKAEWLDPVCSLYFGTLYNPSKYLDFNFLALVQALEAYHRRASSETDLPSGEHDARIKAILDAAPVEHRDWLAGKLTYGNELSLRRRLKILFTRFSYLLDDLIPDRKATISAIYDNRNYLTHYDAMLKDRAASGARLLFLVEILKLLLQACLLAELGLPDVTVKEFVSRSRTVRMIRHLSNRLTPAGS